MNSVNMLGRVARDIDLKDAGTTKVAKFAIGFDNPYKKDESNFIDCVAFGTTAETMEKYLKKGDPILVTGRLQQDKWQNKDGANRSKIVLNCERFTFVPVTKSKETSSPKEEQLQF